MSICLLLFRRIVVHSKIDDFNHCKCFGEELERNYKYKLLRFSDKK